MLCSTNLKIGNSPKHTKYTNTGAIVMRVTQNVEHVFGLELPNAVDVKLAPNEHVAYEWVDWREAAKRVFSWTNVEALRLLGERNQLTL